MRTVLAVFAILVVAGCGPTVPVPTYPTTPPRTTAPATPTRTTVPTTPPTTPPTTAPTTSPRSTTMHPVPTTPPPSAGVTAAARLGWGSAVVDEEFTAPVLDRSRWNLPGECWPANDTVRAGRCASHDAVTDGYLRETGSPDGKTGYLSSTYAQRYGRWEVRARIIVAGTGAAFHPVLLTWPQSEQWPSGGENDYLEVDGGDTRAQAFIHHHTQGAQDHYTSAPLDLSAWHNYALDWQPGSVDGYLDGVRWFHDTDPAAQAPGPMHGTIQLDNFHGTGMALTYLDVDSFKVYQP